MTTPTMEVSVRRKQFGARQVIADLVFTLRQAEIVALVGPSGCGKTTLLKIIGGLDHAFEGSISWPHSDTPRIGTVFQEPRLLPWRTVWQNLQLVLPPGREAEAEALLEGLGLGPFRDSYPTQISLGMARRAAIARAFAIGPDLVLLDEPFVSLDPVMAERGREVLLDAWRRRPTSALIVTHDMMDAAALADRVLLLSASPTHVVREFLVPPELRRGGTEAAHALLPELRAAQSPAPPG